MGRLFFILTILFSEAAFCQAEPVFFRNAQLLTKFLDKTIEQKDIPATCWFLGQIRANANAWKLADTKSVKRADDLVKLVDEVSGRCGGGTSQDLKVIYTDNEWKRLSIGINKLKSFKDIK